MKSWRNMLKAFHPTFRLSSLINTVFLPYSWLKRRGNYPLISQVQFNLLWFSALPRVSSLMLTAHDDLSFLVSMESDMLNAFEPPLMNSDKSFFVYLLQLLSSCHLKAVEWCCFLSTESYHLEPEDIQLRENLGETPNFTGEETNNSAGTGIAQGYKAN